MRAFQLAWPPLAYSITDDDRARRFYAAVTTWYVVATGLVVAGLTLLGRWLVRLLAAPEYFDAHEALPWVALGWAMYGLYLVFVTIGGRAGVTTRNFPASLAGLVVNVVVLVALVGPLGIAGAGIALVAAYAVMLVVLHLLTRHLFTVPFEWGRLAHAVALLAGISVAGELALPTAGAERLRAARARAGGDPRRVPGDGLHAPRGAIVAAACDVARRAGDSIAIALLCGIPAARRARAAVELCGARTVADARPAATTAARGCGPSRPRAGPRRAPVAASR